MAKIRKMLNIPDALIRMMTCAIAFLLIIAGSVLAVGCNNASQKIFRQTVTSEYGRDSLRIALVEDLYDELENCDMIPTVMSERLRQYAKQIEVVTYTASGTSASVVHKPIADETYDYIVILLGTGGNNVAITENPSGLKKAYTEELTKLAADFPQSTILCLYNLYDTEGGDVIREAITESGIAVTAIDMKEYDSHLNRSSFMDMYLQAGTVLARCIGGMESIRGLDVSKPAVALTFDDGPNTTTTRNILDILEQYDVKASFFLIGSNIQGSSESIIRRELSLGCEVNCHSYAHDYMNKMTADEIEKDMDQAVSLILKMTGGVYPMFFRPPYIAVNDTMYETIPQVFIAGFGCNDWDSAVSVDARIHAVLGEAKDGEIILLHDAAGNRNTVEALPAIIEGLREKGYQLVTCTQLFALKGIIPGPDKTYTMVTQ